MMALFKLCAKRPIWSISLFRGESVSSLKFVVNIKNPIITAKDVKDLHAEFVADPFIVKESDKYYIFFEAFHKYKQRGVIGLATSVDGESWKYEKIVLSETYHLSYPYVFKHNSEYYMMPESGESGYLYLYKAKEFPYIWEKKKALLCGDYGDASIFQYGGMFWILTEKKRSDGNRFDNLHLYYANDLFSDWCEHPLSPIITNDFNNSRPAGRIIVKGNRIIRFAQQDEPYYGKKISAFEIKKLNTEEYHEEKLDINYEGTSKKNDWNSDGMHHIDMLYLNDNNIIACADGHEFKSYSRIIYKIMKILYKKFNK